MLKRFPVLLSIMIMSLVFTGCSKGANVDNSQKTETQPGANAEEAVQPGGNIGSSGETSEAKDKTDESGYNGEVTDETGKTSVNTESADDPDKDAKEDGAAGGSTGKSEKDNGKKDRNLVTKFYELVSIDGHTRSEFQADEDLCSDYNAWEFAEYGTGIIVDFDYDEGYVQYTWQSITQNAYSSAPIDNPSGTMDILAFSFDPDENIGRSEVWDTVDVSYSDEVITVTYSGGCVEVYKLQ